MQRRTLFQKFLRVSACVLIVIVTSVYYFQASGCHYPVPPFLAARVRDRVPLLRPGMTEQQVWSTLGLTGWRFHARVSGSGSPEAFPAYYKLWSGYVLFMRWDYTSHPTRLVKAEFREHL